MTVSTDEANFALALTEMVPDAMDAAGVIGNLSVWVEAGEDEVTGISDGFEAKRGTGIHLRQFKFLGHGSEGDNAFTTEKINEAHVPDALL